MASRLGLFITVLAISFPVSHEEPPQLIVWNVGQGQWVTKFDGEQCFHFDLGGEFAPWSKIETLCRTRRNLVSLSHWDWDHIGFVAKALRHLPDSCLLLRPLGEATTKKTSQIDRLPKCDPQKIAFQIWSPKRGRDANSLSHVILWQDTLIPGDSGRSEEALWSHALSGIENTKLLILGHHGSRTSTGTGLLFRLSRLQEAVASGRRARYGHPHQEVLRALEERKVPLLATEDWGTIHFYD